MIIAVSVLGALLLISLFINFALWYCLLTITNEYIKDNPKTIITNYIEKEAKEKLPCTLFIQIKENKDFTGTVYDFSQYETNKVVGLTEYRGDIPKKEYEDENGESKIIVLPNQIVYQMKDGSFQWDFRHLI